MDGYFARDAFDVDGLHIRKSAKITSEIENLPRIAIKPQYGRVRLVDHNHSCQFHPLSAKSVGN